MTAHTTKLDGAMMTDQAQFNEWLTELAEPFWLKDSMKQGEFFDVNGFARALLSASKPAAPAQSVAQDERGALTPNQFAAIRAGCASLQKHGGYAPFGIVLQEMLDQARAASTSANAAAPAQSGEPVAWPYEITCGHIECLINDHQRDGQKQLKHGLNSSGSYLIRVAESFRWCLEQIDAAPQPSQPVEAGEPVLPAWFDAFLTNVCELPDRNSPEDEPEAIVATLEELKSCALSAIESAVTQPSQPAQAGETCKCRRLGDWKGFHHPLCDKAPAQSGDPLTLDMSLEARLADAEADVVRLHKEKMDLWMQVRGYTPQPARTAASGEPQGNGDLVLVERELLGAACYAIDKRRDAPNTLERLRAIAFAPRAPSAVVLDDERAAFEKYLRSIWTQGYGCAKDVDGRYYDGNAQSLWECWHAARAASPQPSSPFDSAEHCSALEVAAKVCDDVSDELEKYYDDRSSGANACADRIRSLAASPQPVEQERALTCCRMGCDKPSVCERLGECRIKSAAQPASGATHG